MNHSIYRTILPLAFAAFCSVYLFGQQTVVSPRIYAEQEAPDVGDLTDVSSYRFQQVYAATDFAHLGTGPYEITRIDWRPGSEMTETIDYPSERFLMTFSTTAVDPSAEGDVLDYTFENNLGTDVQTVLDGPATLTTANSGPAEGPKVFDYGVDLQSSYLYDPSDGNLLMDLTVINGQTRLLLDFTFPPTETTRFIWTAGLGPDSLVAAGPDDGGGQPGGHVIQFTVIPEPNSLHTAFSTWCVLAIACRRQRVLSRVKRQRSKSY